MAYATPHQKVAPTAMRPTLIHCGRQRLATWPMLGRLSTRDDRSSRANRDTRTPHAALPQMRSFIIGSKDFSVANFSRTSIAGTAHRIASPPGPETAATLVPLPVLHISHSPLCDECAGKPELVSESVLSSADAPNSILLPRATMRGQQLGVYATCHARMKVFRPSLTRSWNDTVLTSRRIGARTL